MKKVLCVALLIVCTMLIACSSEDRQYDGLVAEEGIVTTYDETNVTLKVITPPPTKEPVPSEEPIPTEQPIPTDEFVPQPDFVDDGTVYTLTITGVEYTGTITEIIAQLPISGTGTYHIHVQDVCSVTTDAYNLPRVLLDAAGKVYALNNPVEPVYDKATVEEAQAFIDIYGPFMGFYATNYDIVACCNLKDKDNSPEQYRFVGTLIYYDIDATTYNFMEVGRIYVIPVNSLEELYVWVEENVNNDDLYTWTYFN